MFKFRSYQAKTIKRIIEKTKVSKKVVLAAAPASGKTNMSFEILRQLLSDGKRALVLTHGTNIIKSNYTSQYKEYCEKTGTNPLKMSDEKNIKNHKFNVIATIPQAIFKLDISKDDFDILLVDEAHQFYFADHMLPVIKKKISVDLEILMTGTPEEFNLKNKLSKKVKKPFDIYYLAANNIPDKYLNTDTTIELASTNIHVTSSDFNKNDELTITKQEEFFRKFSERSEEILDEIYARLRSKLRAHPRKYYTTIKAIEKIKKTWSSVFPHLGKTIIYCNTIKHAEVVNSYFIEKLGSEKVSMSHYMNDRDSKQILEFKNDPKKLILIVLRRARLGFDLDVLTTIIDFSFSRNISEIYQMYARILRVASKPLEKIYIKVCPANNIPYFKDVVMTGALCLMEEKYLAEYNGKNFFSMEIPFLKEKRPRKSNKSNKVKKEKKGKKTELKQRVELIPLNIPTIKSFRDLYHKDGSLINGVVYVKISEIRSERGMHRGDPWDRVSALDYIKGFSSRTECHNTGAYQFLFRNYPLELDKIFGEIFRWDLKSALLEAKKHKSRKDFKSNAGGAYMWLLKKGYAEELNKIFPDMPIKWDFNKAVEAMKQCSSRMDFAKRHDAAYRLLRQNHLDILDKHFSPRISYDLEKVIEEIKKYKNRQDFVRNSGGAYKWLSKKKKLHLLDEILPKIENVKPTNKKEAVELAKKIKTRTELYKARPAAYRLLKDKYPKLFSKLLPIKK